ncbi:SDR family NAD(P)-dependent oxidoreductase [Streptomyces sp. NPDC051940]|uniref:SDR family NAD(P)-dependent oxidoreductase n=1 Tax=Streptomyces sp. NPDC051940 TaxID=3155675 RepID=UPI00341D342C
MGENGRGARRGIFLTGAAGGIGEALARELTRRGFTVFAGVRRNRGALDDLPHVVPVPVDVTDPGSVEDAAAQVGRHPAAAHGLHAVINNAGVIVQGPLELVPPAELRRQFEVNTLGPAYVTQAFLPLLRAGGGRVINVSAATARMPLPLLAPISASKAALAALSDAQRLELAAWGIPVIVVEPGATETPIFAAAEAAAKTAAGVADPGRRALYAGHLAAFAEVMAKQKNGPVERVVKAIATAAEARSPKRRYVAGSDARALRTLARLPAGVRERLIAGSFGLRKVTPGAAV